MIIERERNGIALIAANECWYVVEIDHDNGQVYSLGNDNPREAGRWCARISDAGVDYVGRRMTRSAALARWRREVKAASDEWRS